MKTPSRNVIKAHLAQIAQAACRVPFLRLHPKLRWLDAVCPLVDDIAPADVSSKRNRRREKRRRLDRAEQTACPRSTPEGRP